MYVQYMYKYMSGLQRKLTDLIILTQWTIFGRVLQRPNLGDVNRTRPNLSWKQNDPSTGNNFPFCNRRKDNSTYIHTYINSYKHIFQHTQYIYTYIHM